VKLYEYVDVVITELDEAAADSAVGEFDRMTPVVDVLEMVSSVPLKDQVLLMTNLLTISGYSQREIASVLGMEYKHYRNRLWEIRKDMAARGS